MTNWKMYFRPLGKEQGKYFLSLFGLFILGITLFFSDTALAQGIPGLNVGKNANGGQTYSLSIQLLVLLTSLTFLPSIILMMTSFTRIIIVLSLLRSALGTQGSPLIKY